MHNLSEEVCTMRKILSGIIIFAIIISVLVGCGNSSSAKLDKTKDWMKRALKVTASAFEDYKGKTFGELGEEPDDLKNIRKEVYPYDEKKIMDDVVESDYDFDKDTLILILRVPIGDEDKEIAKKITGKDAEKYYVEGRLYIKTDKKELHSMMDLMDATIEKVKIGDVKVVAEED